MKHLAPNLFDRRFDDLMEIGRARLPGLAPDWTDYNAHDPGITLMELLAWVTEAQLYSLGHQRRDERAAYAALFGLAPRGTEPARGLIWSDRLDARSPGAIYARSVAIPDDAVVSMLGAEMPTFRPAARLLWVAGRMRRLSNRLADGTVSDFTNINDRGGTAFQPFGSAAGKNDVLALDFECRDDGLFPENRKDAAGALWSIGVRADQPLAGGVGGDTVQYSSLTATLVTPDDRFPLGIAADTTDGLLRTGAVLLDLSTVQGSPQNFTVEFRATRGFERPPRLLRIEPNVVPIVQGHAVPDEVHTSTGNPGWNFQLELPGLRFAPLQSPVKIEKRDDYTNRRTEWKPAVLRDSGPNDEVFELDAATGRVTFGNGVNGRIPPAGATMLASYAVSDGDRGGVAPNRKWQVGGFAGSFGVNVDAVAGGAAPTDWIDERREARRRARDDHALVSTEDIIAAARDLPLLEVARAWVPPPDDKSPRTGTVKLVAMRARVSEQDAGAAPETARWLEAVRRRLAVRMPLGSRLVVVAPRYVDFAIAASIEIPAGRDPAAIKLAIESELRSRLTLTGAHARELGAPVSQRDVTAWIRVVDGVRRVAALRLLDDAGADVEEITVARSGLPRCDFAATTLDVRRVDARAAR